MKKILTTLCLLLVTVATWADRWTPPTEYDYTTSTPLYVKVAVESESVDYIPEITEIAAFVDGECRATALKKNDNGYYTLRVWGNESDMGSTISFKVLHEGLVYTFDATETFDGETNTHDVPITLTLNPLAGVEFDAEQGYVELSVGETYDLNDHFVYTYVNSSIAGTTIDETETPLTVTFEKLRGEEGSISLEDGIITALAASAEAITIQGTLSGPVDDTGYAISYTNFLYVAVVVPKVEAFKVNPTEITAYVGTNVYDIIGYSSKTDGILANIVISPAGADSTYTIVPIDIATDAIVDDVILNSGDFKVSVYSSNNDLNPVTVTIHAIDRPTFNVYEDTDPVIIGMITPHVINVYLNTSDGIDASLFSVTPIYNTFEMPTSPFSYEVGRIKEGTDDTGINYIYVPITVTGRYIGSYSYCISYNGTQVTNEFNAVITPEVALGRGWQWMSPYAYQSNTEVGDFYVNGSYLSWITDNVLDMRTQTGLLYVDPTIGPFGDISQFTFNNGMYKVKATGIDTLTMAVDPNEWILAKNNEKTIYPGYNWIVYPYEFDLTLDEISATLTNSSEGDMIISKDGGFATYNNGEWVHDGFTFEAGKGYMYYNASDMESIFSPRFDITNSIPKCYEATGTTTNGGGSVKGETQFARLNAKARQHGWVAETSKFADNMTIIASLDLNKDDRYVIGAFVGDECRGTGSIVRDGIAFISVAGKMRETVNFRILDTQTGESFDIDQRLSYSLSAGTMKSPVRLSAPVVTGIDSISNDATDNDSVIYDLNGRRVVRPTKGIYIVNGKKLVF